MQSMSRAFQGMLSFGKTYGIANPRAAHALWFVCGLATLRAILYILMVFFFFRFGLLSR